VARQQRDQGIKKPRDLLCPSSVGTLEESVLIGVVTEHPEGPRVVPTDHAIPVTPDILRMAEPVGPREVFRFASPCLGCKCPHFQNEACQLAKRGVDLLDTVTEDLPKCSIRPFCRWFRQEGAAMCKRCPQVVTEQCNPSETMLQVVYGVGTRFIPAPKHSHRFSLIPD
jgi:hypothetical protein